MGLGVRVRVRVRARVWARFRVRVRVRVWARFRVRVRVRVRARARRSLSSTPLARFASPRSSSQRGDSGRQSRPASCTSDGTPPSPSMYLG